MKDSSITDVLSESEQASDQAQVMLISMPFAPLLLPSIGLSLLKASLLKANIIAKLYYPLIEFAELIGPTLYGKISVGFPANHDLAGEWLFSESLFGAQTEDQVSLYLNDVLYGRNLRHSKAAKASLVDESFIEKILEARTKVGKFLISCAEKIVFDNPKIVGFTSVFQQHISSLALAKVLKEKYPDIKIVFGGANCEGPMGRELIKQFSFIDAVVSGEGETIFPLVVQRFLNGQSVADLQGVYNSPRRPSLQVLATADKNTPSVRNLDELPIPDYDDYFEQLKKSSLTLEEKPRLLFETSRGCWWGEKHHCTFCGLNGDSMAYRSKSSSRAIAELRHLSQKYPGYPISVVDNILSMSYFKDFIPTLIEEDMNLELFYEVKANLKYEQVRLLRDAGITQIQPGLESLSDHVLQLMRKGVSGLQNIQLLKFCKEFGITPEWNVLWGFPGETTEDYERTAQIIPFITHLAPPGGAAAIRLDRFSPNFNEPEALGFVNIKPYPAYHHIYPFDSAVVANLAYYFTYDYKTPRDVTSYTRSTALAVKKWREVHELSDLFFMDKGDSLLIWDLRPIAVQPLVILNKTQSLIFQECGKKIQTPAQISHVLSARDGIQLETDEIIACLDKLASKGVLLNEGNSYLNLALPLSEYEPSGQVMEKFLATVRKLGEYDSESGDTLFIDQNYYVIN